MKTDDYGGQHKEMEGHYRIGLNLSANHHHDQHSNGNLVGQCIGEPDSVATQFPVGHDDGLPKTQEVQNGLSFPRIAPSRRKHIAYPVEAMLDKLHHYDMPSFNPPSGYHWVWAEDRLILTKKIKNKEIDTKIHVAPHYQGVFSLIIGEQEIIQLPTLRQAVFIADQIADIFKGILPVPRRLVNTNATEPYYREL